MIVVSKPFKRNGTKSRYAMSFADRIKNIRIREMQSVQTKGIQIKSTVLIALCFLLTSTGWLSWEYHLVDQMIYGRIEIYTMVIGYLLQAFGIGIFSFFVHRKKKTEIIFFFAMILHMICMVPAVVSPYLFSTMIFGFFMNFFCGLIAGYYLYVLTKNVQREKKAIVFGSGYAAAIIASWLLSLIGGGTFYYSDRILIFCVVLTVFAALAAWFHGTVPAENHKMQEITQEFSSDSEHPDHLSSGKGFVLMAAALVFVFSLVNSSGFSFPVSDIGSSVNLELSRLVYAAGLVIAGIVADRSRKYGAICALTALIFPFIMLALRGTMAPAIVFWALSYFAFGFYAVYRILLFSDIASEKEMMLFAGFGLMFGRAGDALGEGICLFFENRLAIQVCVTAFLFVAAVIVFFRLYQFLYVPLQQRQLSEREKFYQFAIQHDLSAREQDMLRLLLERKTNGEIADVLSISENTVKFHIRNLLQKTGCKNRNDLISVYMSGDR